MAGGIEEAVVRPGTWAASVADLSQDLSTLDLTVSCHVEWAELGCFRWETIPADTRAGPDRLATVCFCSTAQCVC